MKIRHPLRFVTLIASLVFTANCFADWKVNSEKSQLSYVSIKNNLIAESNAFKRLSGQVTSEGKAEVIIAMDSVETGVPLRNDRVKEFLFHVSKFPATQVHTNVPTSTLEHMAIGTTQEISLELDIKAIGHTKAIPATAIVSRLNESDYLVFNQDILMINAKDFDSTGGLEKLQELAHLNAIDTLIPMSFQLYLEKI